MSKNIPQVTSVLDLQKLPVSGATQGIDPRFPTTVTFTVTTVTGFWSTQSVRCKG
ncbi:hypothetical protein [Streptococcus merionis]|uniref:Uncharacterized protein n=1 Tax=Streptococcus merionis TaxID=400065 RepID=A0A239SUQ6_9STRE|nr:hypothetical protein [Streptococcus merionis]SNU88558.1 Uncharacterised protein [Streptococcus merionis]